MEPQDDKKSEQFLRLLTLNDRRIYAYILSVVPNTCDADDIMQETSAVMWRKFPDFSQEMDFVLWGITIARYQILTYMRKKRKSKICMSEDIVSSIQDKVVKAISEMDHRMEALNRCVHKLSQADKYLLKLRYENSYTLKDIGTYISKSTRATYYSLVRVHKFLLHCVKRTMTEEYLP